jgi:hypothetical protein
VTEPRIIFRPGDPAANRALDRALTTLVKQRIPLRILVPIYIDAVTKDCKTKMEVARRLGVDVTTLWRWKRGQTTPFGGKR